MDDLNKKIESVEKRIDSITGKKPTKAEKQRQEILDQRKALKEAEKETRSFAYDLLCEFKALNKRLFIIIIVILMLWFSTICGFVWYINQFDYTSTSEVTVDGKDGVALYQDGKGNVINNGENHSKESSEANP